MAKVAGLLDRPGKAQLAARVTVTTEDMDLTRQFHALVQAGFQDVGFAPLRSAPNGNGVITGAKWDEYLCALTDLAKLELNRLHRGESIRLTNLAIALKQIHRGASSPYPCGAGGGYFSVAANGDWYACHRAIGSEEFRLGNAETLDLPKRERFLAARHVDAKADCSACWAKYLCSGGCHHESANRDKYSCDFIRNWLHFCLVAYCESHVLEGRA